MTKASCCSICQPGDHAEIDDQEKQPRTFCVNDTGEPSPFAKSLHSFQKCSQQFPAFDKAIIGVLCLVFSHVHVCSCFTRGGV